MRFYPLAVVSVLIFSVSVAAAEEASPKAAHPAGAPKAAHHAVPAKLLKEATAVMESKSGSSAAGVVSFQEQRDGRVMVQAHLTGLTPNSTHGFHVHEVGDCSAPDGSSAGGHFNPEKATHGGPSDHARHAGDLGNIVADAAGVATLAWTDRHFKLSGKNSVVGRAVIVHAQADDLKTQPTGNAGARIACGVIR